MTDLAILTQNLTYKFPGSNRIGLFDINIELKKCSRLLLIGPNGAGKSTLLKILAGQKLVKNGKILLNGSDPFDLRAKNDSIITYLGTEWANNEITKRDIPVSILVESVGGDFFKERRDELINLLDIDICWRMNQCSDGERRRVQLCMGLLKPWDILLLDEVTVDLDVLVRQRLLNFLKTETETRKCTIVYATHIFDGLGEWPTNIMHINGGIAIKKLTIDEVKYSNQPTENASSDKIVEILKIKSLYPLALQWLEDDLKVRGERTEDASKPNYEEISKKLISYYYENPDRINEYFKEIQGQK